MQSSFLLHLFITLLHRLFLHAQSTFELQRPAHSIMLKLVGIVKGGQAKTTLAQNIAIFEEPFMLRLKLKG